MPPTIDLTRTKHSKVFVSPPRINLRRAASYNHDRGPLSSTSSRFGFNHLLFSPPPSPGLPALTSHVRKPSTGLGGLVRPSRALRLIGWIVAASVIFHLALAAIGRRSVRPVFGWTTGSQAQSDILVQEDYPNSPSPILITDKRGKTAWTVYIPPNHEFPLTMSQYSDMCVKCEQVASRVQALRSHSQSLPQTILAFGSSASESQDRHFIDVEEVEKEHLLPGLLGKSQLGTQKKKGSLVGEIESTVGNLPVCKTSLTVVLESADAGIGKTLMMLWTAYGVALKEGRAFFIDDTRWAYGKYTDIFMAPPRPGCHSPPRHEILPCPRQARHLVVSAANGAEIFGTFSNNSPDQHRAASIQETFDLARQGYEALFRLNRDDNNHVESRVRELTARKVVPKSHGHQNGMAVGIHVRRGDRHPLEFQYQNSYIPTHVFTARARELQEDRFNHTGPHGGEDAAAKRHSLLVLASDDPTTYESAEFTSAARAQERIRLAAMPHQAPQQTDRTMMRKYVDETFGWEGGFFARMFWNLGRAGPGSAQPLQPSAETIRLRSLVGRAYMMDLAVLADASDAVLCTVSATGCRLLAVMMGWESAIVGGNWVNIDGSFGWMGMDW